MGILASIFGSGEVVEKGLGIIDSFIPDSDTEVIAAKTKSKTKLLEAYAPFKIAQRVLAFGFCGVFVFCFLVSLFALLAAWYNGDLIVAQGFQRPVLIDAIIDLMGAFKMHYIALTIVGFYFGGGAFEGIIERRNERKGK